MDIQKLIDTFNEASRVTRSSYHLTLGKAIKWLSEAPSDAPIRLDTGETPGSPHSYRGHYSDLSIEPGGNLDTVGKLLDALKKANGATFCGHKGGDFKMEDSTPLWAAPHGCCGRAIMGIGMANGVAVMVTSDVD